jgi:CheY-like chemotaxis protein
MPAPDGHFVLVVDDDDEIRRIICELLQETGHAARAAAHGQEALALLRAGARPCLILLDLMMPVMDGEVFRAMQQEDPELADIPVVIMTAAGRDWAEAVPAQGLLHKPLKFDAVLQAVKQFCAPPR